MAKGKDNDKDIDTLKKSLGKKADKTAKAPPANKPEENTPVAKVEETTPVTKVEETTPVTKVGESVSVVEETAPVTKVEETAPVTNTTAPKLSIFSQLNQSTEEDSLISKAAETTTKVEEIAGTLKDAATGTNIDDAAAELKAKKESAKVKAGIIVELCDVIFMIICICITWDFSNENQKVFTLAVDRKDAIKKNLTDLYMLSDKKANPKKDIWFLVIGSYIPMLIIAVLMMFRRMKDKQDKAKQTKDFATVNATGSAEIERLKQELEAEKYKAETLSKSITEENNFSEQQKRDKDLINRISPNAADLKYPINFAKGKVKAPKDRAPVRKNATGKRGVQAGVKRGSYNKNK